MSDNEHSLPGAMLHLVAAIGLVLFAPVVIRDLWNWFVVPQFGLLRFTYAMAMGLGALKSLLTYRYTKEKAEWEAVAAGWFLYLFAWGVGAMFR